MLFYVRLSALVCNVHLTRLNRSLGHFAKSNYYNQQVTHTTGLGISGPCLSCVHASENSAESNIIVVKEYNLSCFVAL